jgi:hypothetical protein
MQSSAAGSVTAGVILLDYRPAAATLLKSAPRFDILRCYSSPLLSGVTRTYAHVASFV